jgi:hypothetical protein
MHPYSEFKPKFGGHTYLHMMLSLKTRSPYLLNDLETVLNNTKQKLHDNVVKADITEFNRKRRNIRTAVINKDCDILKMDSMSELARGWLSAGNSISTGTQTTSTWSCCYSQQAPDLSTSCS